MALNPRYAPPYYLQGRIDEELGRIPDARQLFDRFLALAPNAWPPCARMRAHLVALKPRMRSAVWFAAVLSVMASRAAAQTSQRSALRGAPDLFSGVPQPHPDQLPRLGQLLRARRCRHPRRATLPRSHSLLLSRLEFQRSTALEHGESFSVGIALEEVDGVATVLAVAPRSPAAKGGVLAAIAS